MPTPDAKRPIAQAGAARRLTRGQLSRRRILAATLRLAAANGYDATTVAAVMAETGLPASSIYHFFGNKETLVAEAVRFGFAEVERLGHWPSAMPGSGDLPGRAARLILEAAPEGADDGHLRLGLLLALENRQPEILARRVFLEARDAGAARVTDWWRNALLQAGADNPHAGAAAMAHLTFAVIDGRLLTRQVESLPDGGVAFAARALAGAMHAVLRDPDLAPRPAGPALAPAPALSPPADLDGWQRIVWAATRAMSDQGPDGATIARICDLAQLQSSSVYWHFEDKEDLGAAVIREGFARWATSDPAVAWTPRADGDTWDGMARALHHAVLAARRESDFFRVGFMLLLQRRKRASRSAFLAIREDIAHRHAVWYRDSFDVSTDIADNLSWLSRTAIDGLFLGQEIDPRWQMVDFVPLLVAGLRAAATEA